MISYDPLVIKGGAYATEGYFLNIYVICEYVDCLFRITEIKGIK